MLIIFCCLIAAAFCTIEIPNGNCPFVPGCQCLGDDVTKIECKSIERTILFNISAQYPSLETLAIKDWGRRASELDLEDFARFPNLKKLSLTDGKISRVLLSRNVSGIEELILTSNRIDDFAQFCNISEIMPLISILDLAQNYIPSLPECSGNVEVSRLNLSNNKIRTISAPFSSRIEYLHVGDNRLVNFTQAPSSLHYLNLSGNPLVKVEFPQLNNLLTLDLSKTNLFLPPVINARSLLTLKMDESTIRLFDWNQHNISSVKSVSFKESGSLISLSGQLPAEVESFSLTKSRITSLPQRFFLKSSSLSELDLSSNNFNCDKCSMQWAIPVEKLLKNSSSCVIPRDKGMLLKACEVGISRSQPEVFYGKFGEDAAILCTAYGEPAPVIEWYLYRPSTYLGAHDPAKPNSICYEGVDKTTRDKYSIVGGALILHNINRTFVERYVCVARNIHGNGTRIVKFRLDYKDWYSLSLFDSVFWGALAFCIVVCAFSFVLNITWILTRKSILWWIHRAERLSRVRKMVEAMEKYRVRQLESLQENYTRRVQLVRDSYHSQVEQIRMSYASQAERFRDYRAAQMETVTSHIENIRDNYQQQLNRMREYGSRRAEQLWESYERQVNRMKTFSLQHRLKLMRQYKIKQRHLNKLLESFTDHFSPEDMKKHEEEVRAALEMPEMVQDPLSRSSSFYSLPEYVLDEEGVLRPSPLVPRFTRNLNMPRDTTENKSIDEAENTNPKKDT